MEADAASERQQRWLGPTSASSRAFQGRGSLSTAPATASAMRGSKSARVRGSTTASKLPATPVHTGSVPLDATPQLGVHLPLVSVAPSPSPSGRRNAFFSSEAAEEPALQGYVYKRGGGRSFLGRSTWKRRYFVLAGARLAYYKAKDHYRRQPGAPLKAAIDLHHASVRTGDTIGKWRYFELITPQRRWSFRVGDDGTKARWLAAIGSATMQTRVQGSALDDGDHARTQGRQRGASASSAAHALEMQRESIRRSIVRRGWLRQCVWEEGEERWHRVFARVEGGVFTVRLTEDAAEELVRLDLMQLTASEVPSMQAIRVVPTKSQSEGDDNVVWLRADSGDGKPSGNATAAARDLHEWLAVLRTGHDMLAATSADHSGVRASSSTVRSLGNSALDASSQSLASRPSYGGFSTGGLDSVWPSSRGGLSPSSRSDSDALSDVDEAAGANSGFRNDGIDSGPPDFLVRLNIKARRASMALRDADFRTSASVLSRTQSDSDAAGCGGGREPPSLELCSQLTVLAASPFYSVASAALFVLYRLSLNPLAASALSSSGCCEVLVRALLVCDGATLQATLRTLHQLAHSSDCVTKMIHAGLFVSLARLAAKSPAALPAIAHLVCAMLEATHVETNTRRGGGLTLLCRLLHALWHELVATDESSVHRSVHLATSPSRRRGNRSRALRSFLAPTTQGAGVSFLEDTFYASVMGQRSDRSTSLASLTSLTSEGGASSGAESPTSRGRRASATDLAARHDETVFSDFVRVLTHVASAQPPSTPAASPPTVPPPTRPPGSPPAPPAPPAGVSTPHTTASRQSGRPSLRASLARQLSGKLQHMMPAANVGNGQPTARHPRAKAGAPRGKGKGRGRGRAARASRGAVVQANPMAAAAALLRQAKQGGGEVKPAASVGGGGGATAGSAGPTVLSMVNPAFSSSGSFRHRHGNQVGGTHVAQPGSVAAAGVLSVNTAPGRDRCESLDSHLASASLAALFGANTNVQGSGAALCLQHGGGPSTAAANSMADEADAGVPSEPHYLAVVSAPLLDRWSLFKSPFPAKASIPHASARDAGPVATAALQATAQQRRLGTAVARMLAVLLTLSEDAMAAEDLVRCGGVLEVLQVRQAVPSQAGFGSVSACTLRVLRNVCLHTAHSVAIRGFVTSHHRQLQQHALAVVRMASEHPTLLPADLAAEDALCVSEVTGVAVCAVASAHVLWAVACCVYQLPPRVSFSAFCSGLVAAVGTDASHRDNDDGGIAASSVGLLRSRNSVVGDDEGGQHEGKSGWLQKKGTNLGSYYQWRWFVFHATDMRLSYYLRPGEEDSDAEQSEPPPEGKDLCGTLPLAGAEICVDRKSRTDFKLRHGSWRHDYLLRAADGRERSLWIAALRLDAAQF